MDIDVKKLIFYIKKVLPNYLSPETPESSVLLEKFSDGQSNPTYRLIVDEETKLVLRRKPFGELLKGAHQIQREYKIMKALLSINFPVPKMLHFCDDQQVIGSHFYLMEYMKGSVIGHSMKNVAKSSRQKCIFQAIDILAQLHSSDIKQLGLSGFGKHSDYCKRVIRTWTKQYQSAATFDNLEIKMKNLIKLLEDKVEEIEDKASIIHGDYSLLNILYDEDQMKITSILDWELSTIGHPLADLAYFCMMYHAPVEFFMISDPSGTFREIFDEIPTENEVIFRYCQLTATSFPIKNWNFFLALNFFKLASIIQGVYSRYLQGNSSSERAREVESFVEPLVQTALDLMRSEQFEQIEKMILSPSQKGEQVLQKVKKFLTTNVDPHEKQFTQHLENEQTVYKSIDLIEKWRKQARSEGLWNLFLPDVSGLSNVDYAHIAEYLGRSAPYSSVFNCNAPDTGNMEVLHLYGSEYQKKTWLQPLLDGEINSAFCMTEPQVASSDATNMELTITRDGDHYLVHGRKWWSTGAGNPTCAFGIVMGRTVDNEKPRAPHLRHSMIVVPFDTPGVKIVRMLSVFGYHDRPHGHGEIHFNQVRVPIRNLILGEGRGFEISQGRLGPGRVHHCMRSIGLAERALELFVSRARDRKTFGKLLLDHQVVRHKLAECRIAIHQCRLMTLHCAYVIDEKGTRVARKQIAMIKVAVPRMLCDVIDNTIQVHGGAGVSQDFPLAQWYAAARTLRLADGPDEVHLDTVAKLELRHQIKAKI